MYLIILLKSKKRIIYYLSDVDTKEFQGTYLKSENFTKINSITVTTFLHFKQPSPTIN